MAEAFLSLRRVRRDRYPLEEDLKSYFIAETGLGRMLD